VSRLLLAAGSVLDAGPEAVVDAAAAAGFAGVGLRESDHHAGADPAALRRRADDLGIVIHDVEVYRIGARTPAAPLLDAAAELGARAVLVVSDVADLGRTTDEVGELVAAGRQRGLIVGLEYMAWTTPAHPSDAVTVAGQTGCVIVVDVLHHRRVGAGTAELDAVVASGSLGWVQLCDAIGAGPKGEPFDRLVDEARHHRLPPGDGDLPLLELLRRTPAESPISVEVQSDQLLALAPPARATVLHTAATRVLAALASHPNRTG
jgi:sugar phosphate isomerase/epimerase